MKLHVSNIFLYFTFAASAIAKDADHKSAHQLLTNAGDSFSSDNDDMLSIYKKPQTPLRGGSTNVNHNDNRQLSSWVCSQWGWFCQTEVKDVPPPCFDTDGWMDVYGDGCNWYATYDGCDRWGHITGANTHCCACGGSNQCKDTPTGWYDSDGPVFDCAWYAEGTRCEDFGNGFADAYGITANIACCACDGGCYDSPTGWYDSDGPEYDCAWYAEGTRCEDFGNDYVDDYGVTANMACCACGGGNGNYWRNSVRNAPANKDMIRTKYPDNMANGSVKSLDHAKAEGAENTKNSEETTAAKSVHSIKSLDHQSTPRTKKHPLKAKEKIIHHKPIDHPKPNGKE